MSVSIRESRLDDGDIAIWLGVRNAARPEGFPISPEVLRHFHSINPDRRDWIAALDGEDVGAARCSTSLWVPTRDAAEIDVLTHPSAQGRGVGGALFEQVCAYAREIGCVTLTTGIVDDDEHTTGFVARRGFEEIGREQHVILEVAAVDPGPPAPPDGVELTTLTERPDLTYGMWEVLCEAVPDIPGEEEILHPYEEWVRMELDDPGFHHPGCVIALAGDEVIGWAGVYRVPPDGVKVNNGLTGVKRAWRGKGVAGAMKRAQIAWARSEGVRSLATNNELRNEPIRRLNERLGYVRAPDRVALRAPVPPPPAAG